MPQQDPILNTATRRLAAVIEDQERLLEIIRREKTDLIRLDDVITAKASPLPTRR